MLGRAGLSETAAAPVSVLLFSHSGFPLEVSLDAVSPPRSIQGQQRGGDSASTLKKAEPFGPAFLNVE